MYQSAYREHPPLRKHFNKKTRTQQSHAAETNINTIMAKYQKTGLLDHVNEHGPTYGDQPAAEDFHAAMNLVAGTNSLFEELPSSTRELFENDPAQFLAYVSDEDRRNDLINTKKINLEESKDPLPPEPNPAPIEPDPGE